MPEFPLTDSIITSLNAQEPWPDNVRLFQPYEVEQILLPDNASCLAVQAFLKMCNLPFEVEMRWNAEFMSPSGRVPFIKCGAFVVSELEPIVQFAANKGVTLCGKLSSEEKAEMRAYMSLITNVLVNAELYISWIDEDTYNAVTKVRNSSVYPWPLGWLQTRAKRNAVGKRLRALHWGDKTLEQVLADVEQCCNSLSQRLGERDYFFGTTPTPLDALVYGHVRGLLAANGPKASLLIKPMTTSLLKHAVRMTHATGMKLSLQEEHLLSQAFQVTRSKLSPERSASERSTRIKKSRLCIMNPSRENVTYNRELMFGFKPFACKQIVFKTERGLITCKFDDSYKHSSQQEDIQNFARDVIEDILDKVEETAFDDLSLKYKDSDFEIVYPNISNDEMCTLITLTKNPFLDTIDENVTLNTYEPGDMIHVLKDDDDHYNDGDLNMNDIMDSDGVVNDKLLDVVVLESVKEELSSDVTITDSSNNKAMKDGYGFTVTNSVESKKSETAVVCKSVDDVSYKSDGTRSDASRNSDATRVTDATPVTEVDCGSDLTLKPSELDALVFGHVFTIITTRLPCRKLADTVRRHETLVALAKRIDEQYFKRT